MQLDLSMPIAVAAVFLVAGAVKGVVGLGLPTISMALLSTFMPPGRAAAILIVPTLLTNVWQVWDGPELGQVWRRFWPMLAAMALGTLPMSGLLAAGDVRASTALLGAIVIAYAVLGLTGTRMDVAPRHEPWLGPVVGLVTGLINGATGIFVVPYVPYLQGLSLGRSEMVQAVAMAALFAGTSLAVGLVYNGAVNSSIAVPATIALAASFAGMSLGKVVRDRMSIETFRRAILVALVVLGASMLGKALI